MRLQNHVNHKRAVGQLPAVTGPELCLLGHGNQEMRERLRLCASQQVIEHAMQNSLYCALI